jgi:hypothetical protein
MRHFVDDNPGYLSWIAGHPEDYALSTTRSPSAGYLMLHRAGAAGQSAVCSPRRRH